MPLRGVERKNRKNRQKYIKIFFHVFICFYLFFFLMPQSGKSSKFKFRMLSFNAESQRFFISYWIWECTKSSPAACRGHRDLRTTLRTLQNALAFLRALSPYTCSYIPFLSAPLRSEIKNLRKLSHLSFIIYPLAKRLSFIIYHFYFFTN